MGHSLPQPAGGSREPDTAARPLPVATGADETGRARLGVSRELCGRGLGGNARGSSPKRGGVTVVVEAEVKCRLGKPERQEETMCYLEWKEQGL